MKSRHSYHWPKIEWLELHPIGEVIPNLPSRKTKVTTKLLSGLSLMIYQCQSISMCLVYHVVPDWVVLNAKECVRLYQLLVEDSKTKPKAKSCTTIPSTLEASSCATLPSSIENSVMLWQCCLGHPNFKYLEKWFSSLFNKTLRNYQCEICQLCKHTQSIYPPESYKLCLNHSLSFTVMHEDVHRLTTLPVLNDLLL